jgi:hypothetical protein
MSDAPDIFSWETIGSFGSLGERDRFLDWMRRQITSGVAEEVAPQAFCEAEERWFKHIPSGSVWRLVPDQDPYGPGFWPAYEDAA